MKKPKKGSEFKRAPRHLFVALYENGDVVEHNTNADELADNVSSHGNVVILKYPGPGIVHKVVGDWSETNSA